MRDLLGALAGCCFCRKVFKPFGGPELATPSGVICACALAGLLCRKIFEPFGGLKPAMHAARDNRDGEAVLEMSGWDGELNTSDPEYQKPQVH